MLVTSFLKCLGKLMGIIIEALVFALCIPLELLISIGSFIFTLVSVLCDIVKIKITEHCTLEEAIAKLN